MKSKLETELTLTPNCLLTQSPLVFGSGKTSPFYSERYWHYFPEFLAEHGYPVFHFFFPQTIDAKNAEKLKEHFDERKNSGQTWHLVVDQFRFLELKKFDLNTHPVFQSITVLSQNADETLPNDDREHTLVLTDFAGPEELLSSFQIHKWITGNKVPSSHILGLAKSSREQIAKVLLQRAISLAESEFVQKSKPA